MKAVMVSMQPKFCELIISGKKIIEVRKTRPKVATPFTAYIYQTRKPVSVIFSGNGPHISEYDKTECYTERSGKVIGEFVCDKIERMTHCGMRNEDIRLRIVDENLRCADISREYLNKCQLSYTDMTRYANVRDIYGWHISNLIIYDKPRELSAFSAEDKIAIQNCKYRFCYGQPESVTQHGGWIKGGYGCMKSGEPEWCDRCLTKPLTRPPQSWCYVEEYNNL